MGKVQKEILFVRKNVPSAEALVSSRHLIILILFMQQSNIKILFFYNYILIYSLQVANNLLLLCSDQKQWNLKIKKTLNNKTFAVNKLFPPFKLRVVFCCFHDIIKPSFLYISVMTSLKNIMSRFYYVNKVSSHTAVILLIYGELTEW